MSPIITYVKVNKTYLINININIHHIKITPFVKFNRIQTNHHHLPPPLPLRHHKVIVILKVSKLGLNLINNQVKIIRRIKLF